MDMFGISAQKRHEARLFFFFTFADNMNKLIKLLVISLKIVVRYDAEINHISFTRLTVRWHAKSNALLGD